MKKMSRRTAIFGCTGMAAIQALAANATADEKATDKREYIVIGPFKLGEWFDSSKHEIDGVLNPGAPDRKEIIKSFNECVAYIIDERVWKDSKHVEFANGKDFEPKLVVTGKLNHIWQNKGNTYAIRLAELKVAVNHTNYADTPAWRGIIVNIGIETTGSSALVKTTTTIFFSPAKDIEYGINGKLK